MITTSSPDQVSHTFAQLQRMYEALAALRRDVLPRDVRLFALMAEGTIAQIGDLEQQLRESVGLEQITAEAETDVWIKAEGPDVTWPETRSSVLTNILDSVRKGIQNIAEHLLGYGASGGRPLEILKQACDLEVIALQPGSLRVALRLPPATAGATVPESPSSSPEARIDLSKVGQALSDYLAAASWAASNEDFTLLDQHFADESYRKLLLAEVKRLAPRQKGSVDSISISGRFLPAHAEVRLTKSASKRIQSAIYRDLANPPQEHEGLIRQVDLDDRTFSLRKLDQVEEVCCAYSEEFQQTVKEALDRSVRVAGIRKTSRGRLSSTLEITNLEIL